jgi:arylsulfatase A-like enzyme
MPYLAPPLLRRAVPLLLLGLLGVLAAPACDVARSAPAVESVLLVTLDTTRADVLDGGAASRMLAPRIAALADRGVRFPRAYTVAPLTLPAHASLFTGLVPPRHGLRDNGQDALPESATTLAEVLAARGVETAAFVSSVVLDRGFGLDQGFERWDQPALDSAGATDHAERPAAETARVVARWLAERDPARPFFAWVHLYDAHLPYAPSTEHLLRAAGDAYRGEVAALDDAVGVLVDALAAAGVERETLTIVTADHGESLGEHGEPSHGALCYEATMRVPLVMCFPGAPPEPGRTALASLVDVAPTVLARLGVEVPEVPGGLDGLDLFDAAAPHVRGVYFESCSGYLNFGWSPLAGWLDSRGKYLHSSRPEFYVSLQDPHERQDLAQSRVHECELARARLRELFARPALGHADAEGSAAEEEELAEALSALGYARGGLEQELPSPLDPCDRPSPRERAHELTPLLRAHALFEARRYVECRPLVAEIVRENPGHLLALDLLALCLMHAREFERAEEVLLQRLARGPEVADARLNLGLCQLELGRTRAALAELEAAQRLAPEHPEVLAALARARGLVGR